MPHLFYFLMPPAFVNLTTHLPKAIPDFLNPDIILEPKLDELMELLAN